MPIFEYLCRKCGKQFEVFQRITDNPLKKCSFCEGRVNRIDATTQATAPKSVAVLRPVYKKVEKRVAPRKTAKRPSKMRKRA